LLQRLDYWGRFISTNYVSSELLILLPTKNNSEGFL